MIEIIFTAVFAISNILMFRKGFKLGIKKEQQARLRRLNTLKKLINNRAEL
jgi:basic membrane lipoprotein Med (substrate-binding protein (PBP1-ABC) superfamily)